MSDEDSSFVSGIKSFGRGLGRGLWGATKWTAGKLWSGAKTVAKVGAVAGATAYAGYRAIKAVKDAVSGAIETIEDAAHNIKESVKEVASNVADKVAEVSEDSVDVIQEHAYEDLPVIKKAVESVISAPANALGKLIKGNTTVSVEKGEVYEETHEDGNVNTPEVFNEDEDGVELQDLSEEVTKKVRDDKVTIHRDPAPIMRVIAPIVNFMDDTKTIIVHKDVNEEEEAKKRLGRRFGKDSVLTRDQALAHGLYDIQLQNKGYFYFKDEDRYRSSSEGAPLRIDEEGRPYLIEEGLDKNSPFRKGSTSATKHYVLEDTVSEEEQGSEYSQFHRSDVSKVDDNYDWSHHYFKERRWSWGSFAYALTSGTALTDEDGVEYAKYDAKNDIIYFKSKDYYDKYVSRHLQPQVSTVVGEDGEPIIEKQY